MTRARPIHVGPYAFSLHDARRTVAQALESLAEFPSSTHAAQADRVRRIVDAIGGADLMTLDIEAAQSVLNEVWPLLMSARDDRVRADDLPGTTTGRVVQLSRSGGGVPKLAVDSIAVDFAGVEGDVQKTRRHHGRPQQALCLWNIESIEALRADGHPIDAGSAGENVTVAGLPWDAVTRGIRLRIGTVLCEVSGYTLPCAENARWFNDRKVTRIHYRHGPYSRLYATVLQPGEVTTGDDVVLEPER